jgi:L-fuculose-phosphate aldolase
MKEQSQLKRTRLSEEIIETCLRMNREGLNQGTSGNVSARLDGGMLITPSGRTYESLIPEDIVFVDLHGHAEPDKVPSSEWHFHLNTLKARPDVNAVVHTHAIHCTALAIRNLDIPALHYMVAAAGGSKIPCVPYATYGTEALSVHVVTGLKGHDACLMQHHGMLAVGKTLAKAYWLAQEVEVLAELYLKLLPLGEVPVLSEDEMAVVLVKFANYGLKES